MGFEYIPPIGDYMYISFVLFMVTVVAFSHELSFGVKWEGGTDVTECRPFSSLNASSTPKIRKNPEALYSCTREECGGRWFSA